MITDDDLDRLPHGTLALSELEALVDRIDTMRDDIYLAVTHGWRGIADNPALVQCNYCEAAFPRDDDSERQIHRPGCLLYRVLKEYCPPAGTPPRKLRIRRN